MAKAYFAVRASEIQSQRFLNRLGRSKPTLRQGDAILLFNKQGEEGLQFVSKATVLTANLVDQNEARTQQVGISEPEGLTKPISLRAIAGSLRKVYRFLNPERHFRRSIIKIPFADFETIANNRVDQDRSIFRYLFSALPFELQTDFLTNYGNDAGIDDRGVVGGYEQLSRSILEYFEEEITQCFDALEWCRRSFKPLEDIRDMPSMNQLVLTSSDGEDATIPLGRILSATSGVSSGNSLFSEVAGERSLLSEAREQLRRSESTESSNSPTNRRRVWNETIF